MKTRLQFLNLGLNQTLAGILVLVALALSGCSEKKEQAPPGASNKVVIKGSNTVGEELAPKLIAEYRKGHQDISFELETNGTGSGFAALLKGRCDIAAASRTMIKVEQDEIESQQLKLNDYPIGSYSVAVVVNASNPLSDLTATQVRDIFTGAVQNWKDVGGADAPIHLFIRDPRSGTYLGFRELGMEDKPYTTNNATAFTDYIEIVKAVAGDSNGIGYANIQLTTTPGIKGVSIGGVPPTAAAVNSGKYPFARGLHFYTNKAAETKEARDFIDFVLSARGQQVAEEMGTVPHP